MNVLFIQNKGLIEEGDLMYLGSSTKRGDNSTIGKYGSGWKFALAWIMRNNVPFQIFRGKEEIEVSFNIKDHRGHDRAVVTVNGMETSITTDFGPEWNGWMALREIISNAIDEGEDKIFTGFNSENIPVKEDVTTIAIGMTSELSKVMRSYDKYFSFERKADFMDEEGNLYYYNNTEGTVIYRKGIRCLDETLDLPFDINFSDIRINESRLTTSGNVLNELIENIIKGNIPYHAFIKLLQYNEGNDVGRCLPSSLSYRYEDLY